MALTMGSLFDGIGGFPLAAHRYGIETLWASEIENFPMAVTAVRFPNMRQMGDITKLCGTKLPPVDIIAGGSPCQDLSVAGKRSGLAGARSGLFMEQIRIIKEMREADEKRGRTAQSLRPQYMLWENVPGAFSSGHPPGEDFRIVLEETCGVVDGSVSVPRPPGGVWLSAGAIVGSSFSIAYRVIDAQFFGVAQRRRRIYLIADFGGFTDPKILFESESLFGDSETGGQEGQTASACPARSSGNTGGPAESN